MVDLYMKERIFSFKDQFKVYDQNENEVYRVEGSFFSFGDQLQITDMDGNPIAEIDQKLMSFLPRYEISINGETVCEMTKKLTFFKPKFEISKLDWTIDGDLWNQDFQVTDGKDTRMSVSKKWLSWGDSYHLQIPNEEDHVLCLAIAIVLDMVLFEDEN
ncbi:LURP-one-related family protein [Bacillus atrophaeus]|uniref:LURP-one-related/scramblase family protein n=1 Tax=Bacillus atrophaeus TaxID=1452 RepID=UPI002282AB37|nr:LURP-one-related family protein [Bacillus atrophaeus]MCY8496870.1 LURP-one-related family protein [Bacillus atrophaeus]MCY8811725.1 LURP-one-related family protein [Bacillus atrophaeus]MCY8820658.1 LURP-one-related family protein [Bacillus atrophaeus]MCY8828137.1 LURP-one-related family protein [Bacillus atrophaeus]MCY8832191.1 LURP-one-related family protein [Bacillus atrophaeus]